ncbi:MAG: NAD(+) synthase [Bacteroidaceae bacterium]|nr:NAD(+) synthase [Bacteroidaceae bacterium]
MQYGYIKVAAAVPSVKVADVDFNLQQIENIIALEEGKGVEIIVFPELSLTGYTCQDLFRQQILLDAAETAVLRLMEFTRQLDIICIVGLPIEVGNILLNCAAVVQKGELLGIIPKTYLPNYAEFYEKRWFASSVQLKPTEIHYAGTKVLVTNEPTLFQTWLGVKFGVEICEDVWAPTPPSNHLATAGADIIFNLSASDELIGKNAYLKQLLSQQSARLMTGYVYASSGFGESTQDVVYGGNGLIYENGRLLKETERFSLKAQVVSTQIDVEELRVERRTNSTFVTAQQNREARIIKCRSTEIRDFVLERDINPLPFIPMSGDMQSSCEEVFSIQVMGLAKRLVHTSCKNVVVGISGGLDSTLALLVCVKTFDKLGYDRKGIIGVTMPGFGTTDRTYNNALQLMRNLGITVHEIPIRDAVICHFKDIGHDINNHDVTYENSQARERTQILMDLANKYNGMVIGTGDLSELALGWATYNGDHMSMYGVNASVPKTLIKYLVRYVAESESASESASKSTKELLYDIIDTPISPELIPADEHGNIKQKTEDLVGPYELHDFFLYYIIRYGFHPKKVFMLAQKAFGGHKVRTDVAVCAYDDETIKKWLQTFIRRFFNQQFKRSCLPDGPKVGSVSLSPRGDWRMSSDSCSTIWMKSLTPNPSPSGEGNK